LRTVRIAVALFALCAVASCKTDEKLFEEVAPAEQLWSRGQRALEGPLDPRRVHLRRLRGAIAKFQAIVDNYPNSDYAIRSELAIADAYFGNEKYEEALSYYRDFSDLHPQHEKVPYTLWQAAQCHERRALAPQRDQAATRDAIVFLDRLLLKHPHSSYAQQAEELWRELQTRLATNVEGIADFYYERGEYEAASERYRALLNEYPGSASIRACCSSSASAMPSSSAPTRRTGSSARSSRTTPTASSPTRARRQLATNLP
jgi:outer membrane assembly lipoprotein YfiO